MGEPVYEDGQDKSLQTSTTINFIAGDTLTDNLYLFTNDEILLVDNDLNRIQTVDLPNDANTEWLINHEDSFTFYKEIEYERKTALVKYRLPKIGSVIQ